MSYDPADEEWVLTWLLPRLEEAGVRVITAADFEAGAVRALEIERAIRSSRCTVAILSPAWLQNHWATFEIVLAQTLSLDEIRRKLIPVLLEPCEVPLLLRHRVVLDLSRAALQERRVRKLAHDIVARSWVPPPALPRGREDWQTFGPQLARWLRRYRRRVLLVMTAAALATLLLLMVLQWPPFQPRPVWMADPGLAALRATAIVNTGISLVVGAENAQEGGAIVPKGLWYRRLPDGAWQESDVGDWLCIEDREPPALANLSDLAAAAERPGVVFALTSHKGILQSDDGGATFRPHPAPYPGFPDANLPYRLVVAPDDVLWVAAEGQGLWRVTATAWERMDNRGPDGCRGLPAVNVRSLLAEAGRLLIGTDQAGLWLSEDGGRTCHRVFDDEGRYEIRAIAAVPGDPARYLLVLRDWRDDRRPTSLLDLCPRPDACRQTPWRAEPDSLLPTTDDVLDLFVAGTTTAAVRWFAIDARGRIWQGDLARRQTVRLPGLPRCVVFLGCDAGFAADGDVPYVLAAQPEGRWPGRVYTFAVGPWWRRLWP
ncbi:MAG: toll/interleukin-1 receptor domain-containing protein [Caldilineales bacterium]|nr:toll/interleukin-1 receptor domain-containing protein [Caldilineales bacterium]